MEPEQIEQKLIEALPSAKVKATDLTGTGDHWQVQIEAEEFRDKTMVEQHQMIYKALGVWMKREIHALSIIAKVPKN